MNKKLLVLLVVGATAGQVQADFGGKIKGFFKATNALLNPIDFTGQKKETKKYDVAVRDVDGENRHVVKQGNLVGWLDGEDFKVIADFDAKDCVTLKASGGTEYYVTKNGQNEPTIDELNGMDITTTEPSVVDQGWAKLNAFKVAAEGEGKTSEAISGFRQAVLGKRKSSALITSAWGVLIGAFMLGRSMAKAEDDEDEDGEEEGDNA